MLKEQKIMTDIDPNESLVSNDKQEPRTPAKRRRSRRSRPQSPKKASGPPTSGTPTTSEPSSQAVSATSNASPSSHGNDGQRTTTEGSTGGAHRNVVGTASADVSRTAEASAKANVGGGTSRRRARRPRSRAKKETRESPSSETSTANVPVSAESKVAPPAPQQAQVTCTEKNGNPNGTVAEKEPGPGEARRRGRRRRGSRRRSQQSPELQAVEKKKEETFRATVASEKDTTSDRKDATAKRTTPQPKETEPDSNKPSTHAVASADERVMLINVAEGEECRIAILHQNRLEELFIERASSESHVGNIYKGRVTNVEPSIQAAFVDFGLPKNGFLHISDLQPQYFPGNVRQAEEVGRKTPRRDRPPIQRCLRRGQEVIVQIIKEGIGTKGPTLTTYVSIPGRYLVMMPGMNRLGVSRRIEDDETRRKMKRLLEELSLPKDMGFILRTAGLDRTKRELQRDLNYLQRLWKVVASRIKKEPAPCELYQESDLVIRTIRDVYTSDFAKIVVDNEETAAKVKDFLSIFMPRGGSSVEVYTHHQPLFHRYDLETEIERLNSRHVPLPSGGSLVIDSTEALVAIDINSSRYREHDDAEENAYRIDLEAAEEIARQLRLRDLGGLILCDFIDLRSPKHCRGVERALREALKKHKERAKCLRMSQFGIIEMTRQRMRPSIKRSIYQDCPCCRGSGLVKNPESMTLDIMRLLRLVTHNKQVAKVEVRVSADVAFQLQNRKRSALHALEQETSRRIVVHASRRLGPDQYEFECLDHRGSPIRAIEPPEGSKPNGAARPRTTNPAPTEPDDRDMLDTVFD